MPFCAPQIVFQQSWTGQTSGFSATLLTIIGQGIYRLTCLVGGEASGSESQWSVSVSGTDAYLGDTVGVGAQVNLQDGASSTNTQTLTLAASSSISIAATHVEGGAAPFDVTVVIEQLA